MLNKIFNKFYIVINAFYFRYKSIMQGSVISLSCQLRVEKGGRIQMGRNSKITSGCIVHVAAGASLNVGDDVWIGPNNVIYCNNYIEVGANTRISHFCTVTDNDYSVSKNNKDYINFDKKYSEEIKIGRNVWLCANSTVLRGSVVKDNTVVSPYSCVRRKS